MKKLNYLPLIVSVIFLLIATAYSSDKKSEEYIALKELIEVANLDFTVEELKKEAFLDLNNIKLESVPEGVKYLKQIVDIDLSGNKLWKGGKTSLENLSGLPRLRDLDLSDNNLGKDGNNPFDSISSLKGLISIDLSNNKLDNVGKDLFLPFKDIMGLRAIDVSKNSIGSEDADILLKHLKSNSARTLEVILKKGNPISIGDLLINETKENC